MSLKKDENGLFINPGADHWAGIVKIPDSIGPSADEPNPYDTKAKMERQIIDAGGSRDFAMAKATAAAVAWSKNKK